MSLIGRRRLVGRRQGRLAKLVALDRAAFAYVARRHGDALDRVMVPLTNAANHSKLWIALAAVLELTAGRRGRRATLRGLGSIAVTSLLVNQVAKRLAARPRPALRGVPAARRLKVQPLTTSFPSGHAASAAAFATAVSAELPAARLPLAVAATAVGYSRVYVGVHYPFDVVVGAAAGAAVAGLSLLQWPPLPRELEQRPAASRAVGVAPRPDGEGVGLVINTASGSGLEGSGLEGSGLDALRERLPRARIVEVDDPEQLEARLRAAAEDSAVLGISGGDGSVVTAAEIALEHDRPLLVLPAGTLNHLGRDLRVETVDDALAALAAGEAVRIDVGDVAGNAFVNAASFGAYSDMLELSDRLSPRVGRWPAHLAAAVLTLARADPVELRIDGEPRAVWMVFAGNCRHEPSGFAPSWRPRLDDGRIDLRIASAERRLSRARLMLAIAIGHLHRSRAYEERAVEQVYFESDDGALTLTRDGDAFDGPARFELAKRPASLVVVAPTYPRTPQKA